MERYWNPVETAPLHELRALQSLRLSQTVRHVYEHVPFYRKKFDEMGIKPEDIQSIDDISKLPFNRICGIIILMDYLLFQLRIWCASMLPAVRLASRPS